MGGEPGDPSKITGRSEGLDDGGIGEQWSSLEEVDGSEYVVSRAKTQAEKVMVGEVLFSRSYGCHWCVVSGAVVVGIEAVGG